MFHFGYPFCSPPTNVMSSMITWSSARDRNPISPISKLGAFQSRSRNSTRSHPPTIFPNGVSASCEFPCVPGPWFRVLSMVEM